MIKASLDLISKGEQWSDVHSQQKRDGEQDSFDKSKTTMY